MKFRDGVASDQRGTEQGLRFAAGDFLKNSVVDESVDFAEKRTPKAEEKEEIHVTTEEFFNLYQSVARWVEWCGGGVCN